MKVYLAGPDVFLPDAALAGRRQQEICAEYGLIGLFPLDAASEHDPGQLEDPRVINKHCLDLLRQSEAVIANLTPFRGPSADVGTAFEHGFAVALGKPVFGYTEVAGAYKARVVADGGRCRAHGSSVEDFDLFDNLMLAENLAAPVAADFRRCCEQVVAYGVTRKSKT